MANIYNTTLVSVTTTGSNVIVYTSPGKTIVRDVAIYAKGTTPTVSTLYNDRTSTLVLDQTTLTTSATHRPFATPLGMPNAHEILVNTSAEVNVLITYVEFD